MQSRRHLQRSLFEEDRKTLDIPASGRSTLVRLIEGLLIEALADGANIEMTRQPQRRGSSLMSKITPEHLARQAVVYIRQSTPDQVVHNLESKRRQYNLPERARQLGWGDVAAVTPALRLSHTSAFGTPPRKESASTWAPIQSGNASLKRAWAKV
jgi:hypothetical protein